MKAIFLFFSLFSTVLVYAQETTYFYFDQSDRLITDSEKAFRRKEIKAISDKKFEIWVSGKTTTGKWSDARVMESVTCRKKGYEIVRDMYSRIGVNTLISVVDTLDDGYVIREYLEGFCFREAEVKYIFPLVLNGKCIFFPKNLKGKLDTKYYWNNIEYSIFPQVLGSGDDSIMTASLLKPDHWPQYPGGENQFFKDVSSRVVFGTNLNKDLLKGVVWISAKVDSIGTLGQVKLAKGIYPEVDDLLVKAIAELDVPWIPGIINGKAVECEYLFPFAFSVVEKKNTPVEKVLTVADQMPVYFGGEHGLRQDIANNIRYPKEAQERKIQGAVYVGFVIDTKGQIRDVRVVRGVHPLLDREAERVVRSLRNWTPGIQDGKNVCVSYTVPINFILQ